MEFVLLKLQKIL